MSVENGALFEWDIVHIQYADREKRNLDIICMKQDHLYKEINSARVYQCNNVVVDRFFFVFVSLYSLIRPKFLVYL